MVPEPSAFRTSFIVMPLLTYALVIAIAWYLGQKNHNRTLSDQAEAVCVSLGQLLRPVWEHRPQFIERRRTKSSDTESFEA